MRTEGLIEETGNLICCGIPTIVLMVGIIAYSIWYSRKERKAWRRFAQKNGLRFDEEGYEEQDRAVKMLVEGRVDGESIRLEATSQPVELSNYDPSVGGGRHPKRKRHTVFSVDLGLAVPDLVVMKETILSKAVLEGVAGVSDIELGDAEVDDDVLLFGHDAREVRDWLADDIHREAILEVQERSFELIGKFSWTKLDGTRANVVIQSPCAELDEIEQIVDLLVTLAGKLRQTPDVEYEREPGSQAVW